MACRPVRDGTHLGFTLDDTESCKCQPWSDRQTQPTLSLPAPGHGTQRIGQCGPTRRHQLWGSASPSSAVQRGWGRLGSGRCHARTATASPPLHRYCGRDHWIVLTTSYHPRLHSPTIFAAGTETYRVIVTTPRAPADLEFDLSFLGADRVKVRLGLNATFSNVPL